MDRRDIWWFIYSETSLGKHLQALHCSAMKTLMDWWESWSLHTNMVWWSAFQSLQFNSWKWNMGWSVAQIYHIVIHGPWHIIHWPWHIIHRPWNGSFLLYHRAIWSRTRLQTLRCKTPPICSQAPDAESSNFLVFPMIWRPTKATRK